MAMAIPRSAYVLWLGLFGCRAEIGDPVHSDPIPPVPPLPAAGSAPALTANLAARGGVRRLSVFEVDNAFRDLIGDNSRGAGKAFPPEDLTPFDNDYVTQVSSNALVEGHEGLVRAVVGKLLADTTRRNKLVGCMPSGAGDEACFRTFATRFGHVALRRPLTTNDLDRLAALAIPFATENNDFYKAVETALTVLLQHPEFLYRFEIGQPVSSSAGLFKLSDLELVSRIAFFLWGSPPTERVLTQAESGLGSAEAVRNLAVAMLQDPRARDVLTRFHQTWLNYGELSEVPPATKTALLQESAALVDRVLFKDSLPWQDLFRLGETYVSDTLAKHYGLPSPGAAPKWVGYGMTGRKGILSHGAYLYNGYKFAGVEGDTSPTTRGLMISERLSCTVIPPPPPDPKIDPDSPPPGTACKVENYRAHRAGECASCHKMIDELGFALERYDVQGRYRTVQPGKPNCQIEGVGDLDGVRVSGPGEVAAHLLKKGVLHTCGVQYVFAYAAGLLPQAALSTGQEAREKDALDAVEKKAVEVLGQRAGLGAKSDFRLDSLLVDLVSSDAFRHRRQGN